MNKNISAEKMLWTSRAKEYLKNTKVTDVRFLTDLEMKSLDWKENTLVIFFDDGTSLIAIDENNNPATFIARNEKLGEENFKLIKNISSSLSDE